MGAEFLADGSVIRDGVNKALLAEVFTNRALSVDFPAGTIVVTAGQAVATPTENVLAVTDTIRILLAANTSRRNGVLQNHGTDAVGISTDPTALYSECPIKLFTQGAWVGLGQYGVYLTGAFYAVRDAGGTGDVGIVEEAP